VVQPLYECWLVSGDPSLGELVGCEVAVGAVRSVGVVVDAPVLDEDLDFEQVWAGVSGVLGRDRDRRHSPRRGRARRRPCEFGQANVTVDERVFCSSCSAGRNGFTRLQQSRFAYVTRSAYVSPVRHTRCERRAETRKCVPSEGRAGRSETGH